MPRLCFESHVDFWALGHAKACISRQEVGAGGWHTNPHSWGRRNLDCSAFWNEGSSWSGQWWPERSGFSISYPLSVSHLSLAQLLSFAFQIFFFPIKIVLYNIWQSSKGWVWVLQVGCEDSWHIIVCYIPLGANRNEALCGFIFSVPYEYRTNPGPVYPSHSHN